MKSEKEARNRKKNLSDNKAPRSWAISGESVHKFLFIRFKESLSFQLVESKFAIWVAEILWRLWLASSLEWICKHDEEETTKNKAKQNNPVIASMLVQHSTTHLLFLPLKTKHIKHKILHDNLNSKILMKYFYIFF